jgi:hypothetical protein
VLDAIELLASWRIWVGRQFFDFIADLLPELLLIDCPKPCQSAPRVLEAVQTSGHADKLLSQLAQLRFQLITTN